MRTPHNTCHPTTRVTTVPVYMSSKKHWNLPTAMVSMIQMLREALDEEKYWAYTNRKTHQLITINWDPNFCDFSIMNRIVSKKWMHEWYYVWEFVNEKESFSHPHVHLLIKKVKPVSQVIREIAYTAGVANNYVDVKEIVTRDLRNVRKYMQKNRPYDVEIREEYMLYNVYSYLRQEEFPTYEGEMEQEPPWLGETKIFEKK